MNNNRENPGNGIADLERVFAEYRTKLEVADQQSRDIVYQAELEAQSISSKAEEESRQCISMAEEESRQRISMAEEESHQRISMAEEESRQRISMAERQVEGKVAEILDKAREQAGKTVRDADVKIKKDAREKAKREIEKVVSIERDKARSKAEEIVTSAREEAKSTVDELVATTRSETRTEASKILARAQEKASKIDKESILRAHEVNSMLDEVAKKSREITTTFKQQLLQDFSTLTSVVEKAITNLEDIIGATEFEITGEVEAEHDQNDKRLFKGHQKLKVFRPYHKSQIEGILECLSKSPGIRTVGESSDTEYVSIILDIKEPLPLIGILRSLPGVITCEVDNGILQMQLKPPVLERIA